MKKILISTAVLIALIATSINIPAGSIEYTSEDMQYQTIMVAVTYTPCSVISAELARLGDLSFYEILWEFGENPEDFWNYYYYYAFLNEFFKCNEPQEDSTTQSTSGESPCPCAKR